MSHILLQYAPEDQEFAHHLAVQLEQRGLAIWPVPDPAQQPDATAPSPGAGIEDASHIVVILSPESTGQGHPPHWMPPQDLGTKVIIAVCNECTVPETLSAYPCVDFQEKFLLGFEELVRLLEKTRAPTHPLTVEHPSPVAKPDLLPIRIPAERCWREDRLRINYHLPIILTTEELQTQLPVFLSHANFELTRSTSKLVRGQRQRKFPLFDPRRAEHSITVRRKRGGLRVYYRMTRLQIIHWFPAHYRVLDREAAALYRYLVTGTVDDRLLAPVERQASLARLVSWGAIVIFWLVIILLVYLIAR